MAADIFILMSVNHFGYREPPLSSQYSVDDLLTGEPVAKGSCNPDRITAPLYLTSDGRKSLIATALPPSGLGPKPEPSTATEMGTIDV